MQRIDHNFHIFPNLVHTNFLTLVSGLAKHAQPPLKQRSQMEVPALFARIRSSVSQKAMIAPRRRALIIPYRVEASLVCLALRRERNGAKIHSPLR